MVTIISKEDLFNTVRYRLSNGWFMDKALVSCHRYLPGQDYSVFEPGASPGGFAAYRGGGHTQKEAMAAIGYKERQKRILKAINGR